MYIVLPNILTPFAKNGCLHDNKNRKLGSICNNFFCLYGQGFEFSILSVMLPIYYSILRHFQQITHHIKLNYLEYYI